MPSTVLSSYVIKNLLFRALTSKRSQCMCCVPRILYSAYVPFLYLLTFFISCILQWIAFRHVINSKESIHNKVGCYCFQVLRRTKFVVAYFGKTRRKTTSDLAVAVGPVVVNWKGHTRFSLLLPTLFTILFEEKSQLAEKKKEKKNMGLLG